MEVGHHSMPHQFKWQIPKCLRIISYIRAHRKADALLRGRQRYECCTVQGGLAAAQPDFFHTRPLSYVFLSSHLRRTNPRCSDIIELTSMPEPGPYSPLGVVGRMNQEFRLLSLAPGDYNDLIERNLTEHNMIPIKSQTFYWKGLWSLSSRLSNNLQPSTRSSSMTLYKSSLQNTRKD
jgi:hypothetical protein